MSVRQEYYCLFCVADFREEIRQHESEKDMQNGLSPEVLAKLEKERINPETVTIKQLFPETLDAERNDSPLMSGAEWEIMITYYETRKYLLDKYPQSQKEAEMLGEPWNEEPEECPYILIKVVLIKTGDSCFVVIQGQMFSALIP